MKTKLIIPQIGIALLTTSFFLSCKKNETEPTTDFSKKSSLTTGKGDSTQIQSIASAGDYSYSKWVSEFINKKNQPTVIRDLNYYKNSIIAVTAEMNFPFEKKSPNGQFSLIAQTDGNLYIKNNLTSKVLWDAGSYKKFGTSATYKLSFQEDGNLVIYANRGIINVYDVAWATDNLAFPNWDGYYPLRRAYYMIQDDGNFVLYKNVTSELSWPLPPIEEQVLQPVAHTGTWGNQISPHWGVIK